jgi:hypothetical protein
MASAGHMIFEPWGLAQGRDRLGAVAEGDRRGDRGGHTSGRPRIDRLHEPGHAGVQLDPEGVAGEVRHGQQRNTWPWAGQRQCVQSAAASPRPLPDLIAVDELTRLSPADLLERLTAILPAEPQTAA